MAYGNYTPYQPAMPGFNPYQQPTPQPMQQPQQGLSGRMVASREEALGVPADFMGTPLFLPDLGHGVIYLKKFDPNTGTAPLYEFRIAKTEEQAPQEYAKISDLQALNDKVDNLSAEIEKLKKRQKGGVEA